MLRSDRRPCIPVVSPCGRVVTNPRKLGRVAGSPRVNAGRGFLQETVLAKPNYSYEKRQRELAKKKKHEQKQEQKRLQKLAKTSGEPSPSPDEGSAEPDTSQSR